jgi:hypothetical protein
MDPFDNLLELENEYYQEGYDAGVADSKYAGMIEGKVFGIEKGYEKATELGKINGRALIWQERYKSKLPGPEGLQVSQQSSISESSALADIIRGLPRLSDTTRLQKHVESLLSASDGSNIAKDNSDDAVTDFDEKIARSKAKAKVIANITGEMVNPTSTTNAGIEDASGLQARH